MILLFILQLFHFLLFLFSLLAPYLLNNNVALGILIIYNILIVTQWYLIGGCILTPLEEYLGNYKNEYENGNSKSYMVNICESLGVSEATSFYIFVLIPIVNTTVCVIKILNNCKNCTS